MAKKQNTNKKKKTVTRAKKKYVYTFGNGRAQGSAEMKELLGGKGANLAEMVRMGIPVPPGFTITTEVCNAFFDGGGKLPPGLKEEVLKAVKEINKITGKSFGNPKKPLLVSVRSGAPASMPGMMDTILNLGINDAVAEGMVALTGDARFVYDAYRRFVMMYADVVLGVHRHKFEKLVDAAKADLKVTHDNELPAAALKKIVQQSKSIVKKSGHVFPEKPMDQLWGAVGAVFDSWNNPRATTYRQLNNIPPHWGTAVNVQTMVFGNMGDDCGTGVAFTRNPATGEKVFFGEWLPNAQGEDVVAGIRTPHGLSAKDGGEMSLENCFPKAYKQLDRIQRKLERHYRDMQDLEFTIENGTLWLLQTRVGKRTGFAAVQMAVDMVDERLISSKDALLRIAPDQLNHLLRPVFDEKGRNQAQCLAKGLPAGPGAATGKIAFTPDKAVEMAKSDPVILVRHETSPEDIAGMNAAEGILTARGGMTSHAALVARQMGKVCVAGCGDADIDYGAGTLNFGGDVFKEGDFISLDGTAGEVLMGQIDTVPSEVMEALFGKKKKASKSKVFNTYARLMEFADKFRSLGVRTNADQPDQAHQAIAFGAEGIGLCRTEHMFFGDGKIGPMRQMILADNEAERRKALKKLLPLQRRDFAGLFKAMAGRPVTIRTLDPPLHEFLPHAGDEIADLAGEMGVEPSVIERKVQSLHEFNPMLGHRGCRLGISYPEITEMQAQAIFEAAVQVKKKGTDVRPEIMIPLVGKVEELKLQERIVREAAEAVLKKAGVKIPYLVGTMIEIPRAALTADQVAESAEFFSFGTNDLTQTTLGMSRDDSKDFLETYRERQIYDQSPFEVLDQTGVGQLVEMGTEKGRAARKSMKIGICGEHGGEPASIDFCHRIGLDYVSCSPFRVPIARLAAAQAALRAQALKKSAAKKPKARSPRKR
ncbi:MAG: pyruvate, phosphate dikinase [Myxococcota bacterium]|nr:pyruvate, phosphate dikinase [Myxococcota bacterium]